jgi:hypothetical protein
MTPYQKGTSALSPPTGLVLTGSHADTHRQPLGTVRFRVANKTTVASASHRKEGT